MSATASLAELRSADEARYGGKSASLGELLAGGIPVPPGFAVSTDLFRAHVAESGLDERIAAILHGVAHHDVRAVRAASDRIVAAVREVPVPDAARDAIAVAYAEVAAAAGIEDPPVAVRSSACGEDSAEATFAGQQETYLWVRGPEHVTDAIRDCWASLYSPEALTYRDTIGHTEDMPAMGVAVQLMVDAEVSGVMFTCNPVSGDPSVVAIDASWGLGLAVVGGEVTPDEFLVSKITREVVRRTINRKAVEYRPDASGRGTAHLEVPADRAEQTCLDDDHLAELVEVARTVERHFGSHQDIEWALSGDGELYVLQSRPVTATAKTEGPKGQSALSLIMSRFGAQ